jgi:hypothetical protein
VDSTPNIVLQLVFGGFVRSSCDVMMVSPISNGLSTVRAICKYIATYTLLVSTIMVFL